MNYLSLFSGIGGLDLGLDRAGWTCTGQVEIDPYCRTVLQRHWPEVPRHDDVRTAPAWWLGRGNPAVELVAGGFPCQPFSGAGPRRGADDERWGWPWFADVLRLVRPRYVLVENVRALTGPRFRAEFGTVLGDLHQLGFDAVWTTVSACAFGAPHPRERVFIVAYPHGLDGPSRLGPVSWDATVRQGDLQASTWPDPVNGPVEASSRGSRVADGLSGALEPARVRAVGNAVVPAIGEYFGRLIAAHLAAAVPA